MTVIRVLSWVVVLAFADLARSAWADEIYDVNTAWGAIVLANPTPCDAARREELVRFIERGVVLTVVGKREHMIMDWAQAAWRFDTEVATTPTFYGWLRQGGKTLFVALADEGSPKKTKVEIAFIHRSPESICYEKWQGVAVRRSP